MLIIGIGGGTGSGKTTVVDQIVSDLPEGQVTVISLTVLLFLDNSLFLAQAEPSC